MDYRCHVHWTHFVRRGFVVVVLSLVAAQLGACARSDTSVCPDGRRCPLDKVCAANANQCVDIFGCGNGELDRNEACDDGNITAGDGCSSDCRSDETCSNGIVDEHEVCDTVATDGLFCIDLGYDFGHMRCEVDCMAHSDDACGGFDWSRVRVTSEQVLRAVWGSGASDVYAVGDGTTILHYDGNSWRSEGPPPPGSEEDSVALHAVWGSGPDDIHAVGDDGTIWHGNGVGWTMVVHGVTSESLRGVWGRSPTDVFAVGDGGTLLHYDGETWSPEMPGQMETDLHGIWGHAGGDVFIVGSGGTVIRGDVGSWSLDSSLPSLGDVSLRGVWGTDLNDVIAVGDQGTVMRFDGATWSLDTPSTPSDLTGVWGSAGEWFAIGDAGVIVHHDGANWRTMNSTVSDRLVGIWGTDSDHIFVGGVLGRLLHHGEEPWSDTSIESEHPLYGIWGERVNSVYAVGANGTIQHYDGERWQLEGALVTDEWLYSVWGNGDDNVFAVGTNGAVVHHDGESWTAVDTQVHTGATLRHVWGDESGVYAAGDSSELIHFSNNTWSSMSEVGLGDFYRVWRVDGVLYVVGEQGVFRLRNGELVNEDMNPDRVPRDMWGLTQSGLFIVGDRGLLTYVDNNNEQSSFEQIAAPTTHNLTSIRGTNPFDMYLVGEGDTLVHFDGATFSPIRTPVGVRDFNAVVVVDDGSVFLLSSERAVHRLQISEQIDVM